MNVRNLFMVSAVVAVIFGLGFVLAAGTLADLYGMDMHDAGLFAGRLFGAALLTIGILTWLLKDIGPSAERQALLLAFFIGDALGFVIALLGQLAEVSNALGWSTVVIYLLFALGFGYFRFMATEEPAMA